MRLRTLILNSLRYHFRSHAGVLFGAAVGSAVLIGALVVGDSVRGSLRGMALTRLGATEIALASNDRFFRAALGGEIEASLGGAVASVVQLAATATAGAESARANQVQLLGIDDAFWRLGVEPVAFKPPAAGEVVLNDRLARQLGAQTGDTVILRVARPGQLSGEAPITPQEDFSVALRLTVTAVAPDRQMGRFSLQASQVPPFTAFVALDWLQERLGLQGRANLLLSTTNAVAGANELLRKHWRLADAELELRELPRSNALELRTRRVFLDPPVVSAAEKTAPSAAGVLTYFVNELRAGARSTPYSMVAALGAPLLPETLNTNEIIVNEWLAKDLQAGVGDPLEIDYFVIGLGRQLQEKTARFRIRSIVPMNDPRIDRDLMPDFPGLEKAESTRDWDPSLPVSLARIRPQDEEYWKQYRGTPKAFVSLETGRQLWGNRFGDLTAIRLDNKPSQSDSGNAASTLSERILSNLDPASVGLRFEPVREQALASASQSQDFGGLFIGFSLFLIAAALLLMALLFQFGVEQRASEIGTLLALGFTPARVRRLLLSEGAIVGLMGGLVGILGGIGYARAMLHGLSTLWRDAVGTSALEYHAQPGTLAGGAVASLLVCIITIWLALRKQARLPARLLLAEGAESLADDDAVRPARGKRAAWTAAVCGALAALLCLWPLLRPDTASSGVFFGAGTLLLIAGIAAVSMLLTALRSADAASRITLAGMSVRNMTRRRKRSLMTVGLLACGCFLIASIGIFRLDAVKEGRLRASGTGGFALVGESTLPIVHDLNTEAGRDFFGLDAAALEGVSVVPLRVRDGDDASCLNLNRAHKPRLLGLNPRLLDERGAFVFKSAPGSTTTSGRWSAMLSPPVDANTINPPVAAVGDANSIQWAMGKKVGDSIEYPGDHGRNVEVRLAGAVANSILQGNLLIDETAFARHFPSVDGYRMFLIDAPSNQVARVAATLTRALRDYGLELTPATTRLEMFNAVQNTYLGTFQVLGGLGLLLGSLGLGVVVLRNVLERRGELAILSALGLRPRSIRWVVLSEHGSLLLLGLGVGLASAAAAVLPTLLTPGTPAPPLSLAFTLAAVLVSGLLWTWMATLLAVRGPLLDALRNE